MKASENTARWLHIGSLKHISFLANDVLIYGSGCCLKFFNMLSAEEHIMIANSPCVNGDGIETVRGHKSLHIFAYAESSIDSIIYIKQYPSLETIISFNDGPREGYASLAFSETSLLIALGAKPNFVITIWNWRANEKWGELPNNVRMENQILRCNWGTPVSMVQLGRRSERICVWDVFTCCKHAVLEQHDLKFRNDEFSPVHFSDCVWTIAGALYVVDFNGRIYRMTDELGLEKEIDVNIEGDIPPSIGFCQSGVAVSGPNKEIRHYVKNGSWECNWSLSLKVGITRICGNSADYLIGVTMDEKIIEFTNGNSSQIKQNRSNFNDFCLIYPTGECVAALRQNKILDIYNINDGKEFFTTVLHEKALVLAENPELPYIAIGYDNGVLELMSIYNPEKPSVMASFHLSKNCIEDVKFFEQGRIIVAGCSSTGEFFVIEGLPGTHMKVVASIHANRQVADFMLVASRDCYRLFLIPVTSNCWAGYKIIRYCIISKHEVNVTEYYLANDEYLYHKIVPTRGLTRDRIFYALPFNSRDIHLLETKRGDSFARIISEIKTGHQMRNIGLHITKYHAVTWGYDGFVFVRDNNFEEEVCMALPHHRHSGGVKKAYVDPLGKYIVSLGRDNNLLCTNIAETEIDEERKDYLTELKNSTKLALMFKRPTFGFKPEGRFENKSWQEVQEMLHNEKEEEMCRMLKGYILREFASIKAKIAQLVTKNVEGPEVNKLDLQEFNLDTALYQHKRSKNKEECKRTEVYLKALIVAQDKVTEHLMENYWNTVKVEGKVVYGFFVHAIVGKYTLLPLNMEKFKRLNWIEEQRKLEKLLTFHGGSFMPWFILPREKIAELVRKAKLTIEPYVHKNVVAVMEHLDTQNTPEAIETQQAETGALTSQYIELSIAHYDQKQLTTFYQCGLQQIVAESELLRLKIHFNKVFDSLVERRDSNLKLIRDRNARRREIISEINHFSTEKIQIEIVDPKLQQREDSDQIKTVMDYEMTVTPYVSPSQQAIHDAKAKATEEERIRLALLQDDFQDRALMAMMNGVLEVRWEDELRREIPVPKCMIEMKPEEFKQEEIRIIKDYEEQVAFLNSERERYKNVLENEFTRISISVRDVIRRFNRKHKHCLEYKMNIDSANNQENLKVNRMRCKEQFRIKLLKREEQVEHDIHRTEETVEELHSYICSLTEMLNDCLDELNACRIKEKILEKAFKKDIQELPLNVQQEATKLYKKWPKTALRRKAGSSIDAELAKCVVSNERSLLLTADCLDFLTVLDAMDQFTDIPPCIGEDTHTKICKHRRLKIAMELEIKAVQIRTADGESTIEAYKKRLISNKEKFAKFRAKLEQIRTDYAYLINNTQIQFVLRKGLVEVPLTGSISDFDDAIMIPRKEIEDLNVKIKEAGEKKIQAIIRNMDFRRKIMIKEWEHQELRMQINDLLEHLNDINNVKITRDMLDYIRDKALGRTIKHDSVETELERIGKAYQVRIEEKKDKFAEIRTQLHSYKTHNDALDEDIKNVNIDVCYLNLKKDHKLKARENEFMKSRTQALLKRTSLVRRIQQNHSKMLVLQTELELLRLKTYPTFQFKIIDM